jgi:hypothetical protein
VGVQIDKPGADPATLAGQDGGPGQVGPDGRNNAIFYKHIGLLWSGSSEHQTTPQDK